MKTTTAVLIAIFLSWPSHAMPQSSVQHPAYVRALLQLRGARHDVQAAGEQLPDQQHAIEQIDRAIRDVQDTLEGDGDLAEENAAPAMSLAPAENLRHALERLARAQDEIEQRQQDSFWKGYKANSAQEHIEAAKRAIHRAMAD